jgi:hypothetical protein
VDEAVLAAGLEAGAFGEPPDVPEEGVTPESEEVDPLDPDALDPDALDPDPSDPDPSDPDPSAAGTEAGAPLGPDARESVL